MKRLGLFFTIALAAIVGFAALVALGGRIVGGAPASAFVEAGGGPVLQRFRTAGAFRDYVAHVRTRQRRAGDNVNFEAAESTPVMLPSVDYAPADMAMDAPGAAQGEPSGQAINPEITNNQTIGVDEGGIVKQVGHFLVILQDGRLFSADLGDGAGAPLRLTDRIDVYRSQAKAADWYDEMLVTGNRILVTAYNYREGASEITVLGIDEAGRLSRLGRYLMSSNDYYSTENYASRLVGDNLILYTPLALPGLDGERALQWPRLRRADGDGEAGRGQALIGPTDVYGPAGEVDYPVLHLVSVCPLAHGMECRTTAFIGPAMREFYVSPTDAFLWIGAPDGLPWQIDYANRRRHDCPADRVWADPAEQSAMLYRLPLDGGAIGAVAVDGVPADQFAFDSHGGRFRALLARAGTGCVKQENAAPLALLDLPLSVFQPRVRRAGAGAYAPLPAYGMGTLENRFVGEWLVYGGRSMEGPIPPGRIAADTRSIVAVPLARPAGAVRLALAHNAIRIERAGSDAIVTGYRDQAGLQISYVSLSGARPRVAATTLLPHRFESEGRSHAFNAWIRADGSGLIGLPTTTDEGRGGRGWSDSQSSELSFIAVAPDKALAPAGQLAPRGRASTTYRCLVSCIDWYGNSRPIFTGGRIFALMGTDLVEGRMESGRIGELGRLDLTGAPARALH